LLASNDIGSWNIHTGEAVFLLPVILRRPDQGKILNLQTLAFEGGRKFKEYNKHNSPSNMVFQHFDSQTGIDHSNTFM